MSGLSRSQLLSSLSPRRRSSNGDPLREALITQTERLQTELARAQSSRFEESQRVDELESKVVSLQDELRKERYRDVLRTDTVGDLRKQFDALRAQHAEQLAYYQRRESDARQEAAVRAKQAAELSEIVRLAESEARAKQRSIETLEEELAEARAAGADFERRLAAESARLAEARTGAAVERDASLARAEAERRTAEAEVQRLRGELAQARAALSEALDDARRRDVEGGRERAAGAVEADRWRAVAQDAEARLALRDAQLAEVRGEVAAAERLRAEAEARAREAGDAATAAREKYSRAKRVVAGLKRLAAERADAASAARREAEAAKERTAAVARRVRREGGEEVDLLTKRLGIVEEEANAATSRAVTAEEELRVEQERRIELEGALRERDALLVSLERKLDSLGRSAATSNALAVDALAVASSARGSASPGSPVASSPRRSLSSSRFSASRTPGGFKDSAATKGGLREFW